MVDQIRLSETASVHEKITFEEFLRLYDGRHAEWIDGEVIEIVSASALDQEILGYMYVLIRGFLNATKLGKVYFAPFAAKLPNRGRGREPDLIFIPQDQLASVKTAHFEGAPALVAEIISDESERRDTFDKFIEYESAGVQEYWLIDPRFQEAAFYRLNERGEYARVGLNDTGAFESLVLRGLVLPFGSLWIEPFPELSEISAMIARLGKSEP